MDTLLSCANFPQNYKVVFILTSTVQVDECKVMGLKAVFWPQMPEPLLLWLKNQTNSPTTAAGSKGEWLLSFAWLPSGQCLLPRPGRFLAFYSQKATRWWTPGWCAARSKAKDCYSLTICHITLRRTNVRRWHYQFTAMRSPCTDSLGMLKLIKMSQRVWKLEVVPRKKEGPPKTAKCSPHNLPWSLVVGFPTFSNEGWGT